jgi:CBS domain containing-hemolysin-like protein
LIAAVFATVSAAMLAMPHSRQGALPETVTGWKRGAWLRYLERRRFVHARWLLLQSLGLTGAVVLFASSGLPLWLAPMPAVGGFLLCQQLLSHAMQGSNERLLPSFVQLLYPLGLLAAPVADPIALLAGLLRRGGGSELPPPMVTQTEVQLLVTEGEQSGAIDHDRSEMIRNVLDFGDTQASDLMVPRTQVAAIKVTTPIAQVLEVIKETEHSRYPVYRDRIDNVIGVLHVKDLFLQASSESNGEVDLERLLRHPVFVPASQLGSSVLREMRAGRHHMAIVIDEYGGMAGLLTLEDVLEEIVGDIQDEHDDEEPAIVSLPNGHLVVDASVPIAELNRHAGFEIPDDGDYTSLGGFIVEMMGRVPEPGAVLDRLGHRFLVRTADERHVTKVEIMPGEPGGAGLQASA